MSKGLIPIKDIGTPTIAGLAIEDVMETHDAQCDDEYTYTVRYAVHDAKVRAAIRRELASKVADDELQQEEVDAFLEIMETTEWDCSFLVDCY